MASTCSLAITLDDPACVTDERFLALLRWLADGGYCTLDGDLEVEYDGIVEKLDTLDRVPELLREEGLEMVSFRIDHDADYKPQARFDNRTTELVKQVQQRMGEAADEAGSELVADIYHALSFGIQYCDMSGDSLGWQLAIGGDGAFADREILERCLAKSDLFTAVRAAVEQIFQTSTSLSCDRVG